MEQKKRHGSILVLAVIVAAALILNTITFQVPFTHLAVVTDFGKITRVIDKPGLYWKWPMPVQQVRLFDKRIQQTEVKLAEVTTSDKQPIIVTPFASWRIGGTDDIQRESVERFYAEVGDITRANDLLAGVLRSETGAVVGRRPFEQFVNIDAEKMQFDEIEQAMLDRARPIAMEKYGIYIERLGLKQLGLPEEATAKVFERMKAEREQLASQYRAEGEARSTTITSAAEKEAKMIERRAEARAIEIRGQGDAQAAEYYNVFEENPTLAAFIQELDALKSTLMNNTTLLIEAKTMAPFARIAEYAGLGTKEPAE